MQFIGYIAESDLQKNNHDVEINNVSNRSPYYTIDLDGRYIEAILKSPDAIIRKSPEQVNIPIELYSIDVNQLISLKQAVNAQSDVIFWLFISIIIFVLISATLLFRSFKQTKHHSCE